MNREATWFPIFLTRVKILDIASTASSTFDLCVLTLSVVIPGGTARLSQSSWRISDGGHLHCMQIYMHKLTTLKILDPRLDMLRNSSLLNHGVEINSRSSMVWTVWAARHVYLDSYLPILDSHAAPRRDHACHACSGSATCATRHVHIGPRGSGRVHSTRKTSGAGLPFRVGHHDVTHLRSLVRQRSAILWY